METVTDRITIGRLHEMAKGRFGVLVKAVVDVRRGLMAVDADMHADEEAHLLETGSVQTDLWGINLYPDEYSTPDFIEFDSMINIRPRQGNRSRSVNDPAVRESIAALVARLVSPE